MRLTLTTLATIAAIAAPGMALAQTAEEQTPAPPPVCAQDEELKDGACVKEENQDSGLDAFGFGVGLALQLGQNAVEEATVDAGLVRVTREADALAGLVLEGHYLFQVGTRGDTEIGLGPFVAVQAGSPDVVDSAGIGIMIGMRRAAGSDSPGWGRGFNIGIGAMFDPNVKKLGDGIFRNEPLPPGETSIRYREEHAIRGVIMVTYSP
jgi:hypothetical protein